MSMPMHLADPRADKEFWCVTCKKSHRPTKEHAVCAVAAFPHLHAAFPEDLYIDFKGWRFRSPFHCMYCAIEVCPLQWAFSRSCGGCDVSDSHTARLSVFQRLVFAGPHKIIDSKDINFIPEDHFLSPVDAEKYPVRNPRKKPPQPPQRKREKLLRPPQPTIRRKYGK